MKGIFIISFHQKPGAFIDREYPTGITSQLGIDGTQQNKIFSLHKMRSTRPNYLFLKVGGAQIASYYSGYDKTSAIGIPNATVTLILDDEENPTMWEKQLEDLIKQVLPKLKGIRGDTVVMEGLMKDKKYNDFDKMLGQKLNQLQKEGPEPPRLAKKRPAGKAPVAKKGPRAVSAAKPAAAAGPTDHMKDKEIADLRNEVRDLHKILEGKDSQILSLQIRMRERPLLNLGGVGKEKGSTSAADGEVLKARIKGEYEALITQKDMEIKTWRSKVSELNEEVFILQDNVRKQTEMMMMMTEDQQHQINKIKELNNKIQTLESVQNAPVNVGQEDITNLRTHMIEVEQQLTEKSAELNQRVKQNQEMFKELKKKNLKIQHLEENITKLESQGVQTTDNATPATQSSFSGWVTPSTSPTPTATAVPGQPEPQHLRAATVNPIVVPSGSPVPNYVDLGEVKPNFASEYDNATPTFVPGQLQPQDKSINTSVRSDPSSMRLLEDKLIARERALNTLKNDLGNAKKKIKLQRREVEQLKKMLKL